MAEPQAARCAEEGAAQLVFREAVQQPRVGVGRGEGFAQGGGKAPEDTGVRCGNVLIPVTERLPHADVNQRSRVLCGRALACRLLRGCHHIGDLIIADSGPGDGADGDAVTAVRDRDHGQSA